MKTSIQKSLPIAIILIISGCIFSCKPKQQQGVSIDAEYKSYFDYQAGSYWVFYDSIFRRYDSLYVVDNNDRPANSGVTVDEVVSIALYEYYVDSNSGGKQWDFNLFAPNTASLSITYGNSEIGYNVFVQNSPFDTGVVSSPQSGYNQTTSLLPSFIVNKKIYNNVYEIVYAYSASSADTFYVDSTYGFLAVLLHNQDTRQRLFLSKSNIIR